jgi:peroxiredoxin
MQKVITLMLLSFLMIQCSAQRPKGLKVGDIAPAVEGLDQNGNPLSVSKMLESGPVVLFFYRGNWCPHCNRYVSQFQDSLQLILDKGASVIAVTPETPEYVDVMVQDNNLTFSILSDTTNQVLKDFKVDFKDRCMKKFFHNVMYGKNYKEANQTNTLPIPATYIIGTDGKITWRYFRDDHKVRASVEEILKNL